jgi:hypothetical protein
MPVDFIEYKGKKILYEDFSNVTPEDMPALLNRAADLVRSCPLGSVLALSNVKDGKFNTETSQIMSQFVKDNAPYVKMTAIFGMSGLQSIIYRSIMAFSGRKNLKVFNDEGEAKEFLAAQ